MSFSVIGMGILGGAIVTYLLLNHKEKTIRAMYVSLGFVFGGGLIGAAIGWWLASN